MIAKSKAHIIRETLDSVAPYITSWVIVDTGSDDGTQEVIRSYMARRGIPGELYERPWHNFGHNRTEALQLAQGHGDYIWVTDADETLVGAIDFSQLNADQYELRHRSPSGIVWRAQLFRDGLGVRYEGVAREHVRCDDPCAQARPEGDYHIESRRPGAGNVDPQKHARDRDLLLAEVERNPEDARSVFDLAQSYFDLGDFGNARRWYERRVEMGGWEEEVFYSLFQVAESMSRQGASWPDVQDAYLRAWEFRPTRAEPLYTIAQRYRFDARYRLGYLFAERAAEIPLPEHDTLFVRADVHAWRAADEQAVCASWIGKHAESFTLCRQLLARPDLPEEDRQRIAANRDVCAPAMVDSGVAVPRRAGAVPAAAGRPSKRGQGGRQPGRRRRCGPPRADAELVSELLHRSVAGRALPGDQGRHGGAGSRERYGFLEFARCGFVEGPGAQLAALRADIDGRFWLHLGEGWRFFAPENLITRLTAVLEAEPQVFQVGINFADAVKLTGTCAPEAAVRRAPDAGRYVLTQEVARGPAMFDTARLDRAGGVNDTDPDPFAALAQRAEAARLRTASLDEVLCTT